MNPIDRSDSEASAVGWHLIARGGDMTARVHPRMQLGVLPSGDISFEAPDAVVALDIEDEHLCIAVLSADHELEMAGGQRLSELKVSPQTHVCLDLLGHTLDIDNDFAIASAPGSALEIHVVREGESRLSLGPLSAAHHVDGEILLSERQRTTALAALPMDYLQREHAAARADKRAAARRRSGVRRIAGALVGSVFIIAALAVIAIYIASRSLPGEPRDVLSASGATDKLSNTQMDAQLPGTALISGEPVAQMIERQPDALAGAGVLARFQALLAAESLPDKVTIDFAVESLKSLMLAYPDDPAVPEALAQLTERLLDEAKTQYDRGDAFLAGRLLEQSVSIGASTAMVTDTLAYFDSHASGSALQEAPPPVTEAVTEAPAAAPTAAAPTAAETEAETELSQPAPADPAGAAIAGASAVSTPAGIAGLDSLVESATGLAMGAMAVELVVTDHGASDKLGPLTSPAVEGATLEDRMQITLDNYLTSNSISRVATQGVTTGLSTADRLPDGFAMEGEIPVNARPPADVPIDPQESGPHFRPFNGLVLTRQVPLEYPRNAIAGSEGSVDVEFTVSETGTVKELSIEGDAPSVFIQEAFRAINQWQFEPVRIDGEVTPVRTALRVTFRG